jgi:predicted nucleotidyltransferase
MATTLDEIQDRTEERKIALRNALDRITAQLRDMGALKVIVFGSFAHGDVTSGSDLGLVAVMPSTKGGKEWRGQIYEEVDRDILAYTQEEVEKLLPASGILRTALQTGRTVYEAGR